MDLHNIRADYAQQKLSLAECASTPLAQLQHWLNQALTSQVNEPTAMNIATVDSNGKPSARIVLLKEINEQGLVFFTNYHSRKGQALTANAFAAATFFWPELERQVRVEGAVHRLPESESDTYFASRPYSSRVGAWASRQSEVLKSKTTLMSRAAAIATKYPLQVPRPPFWGGYLLLPEAMEFWQGRPSRLHDRIHYRQNGDTQSWTKEHLYP